EREAEPAETAGGRRLDVPRARVLGCPARDSSDELALSLFRDLLDPARWDVTVLTPDALSSELLEAVERTRPAVLCVASLPPGGPAPATCASACGSASPT